MSDEAAAGVPPGSPVRILFVFAWLVVGGEETEVALLAQHLDPALYRIEVIACLRKDGMPEQTHRRLAALGVTVDRTPYHLSFEDTVTYLAGRLPAFDIVVSCQDVADIYPALERLHLRPPLIEHGGLVSEALAGPKHLTARYVGVCAAIRDAAASRMPGREAHAVEIPSMVDPSAFDRVADRPRLRQALGLAEDGVLVGWVGRLDAKKRAEDFVDAAAIAHAAGPRLRFVIVGGPDAFMPDYAARLHEQARARGLEGVLHFLGDRDDVPALLAAMDIFVWLSRGEGMPHVIAEAGAAELPVIATSDHGTRQQIEDGETGLFVAHESPAAAAAAILRLAADPALRRRLGRALRSRVEQAYSVASVLPRWHALFQAVLAERPRPAASGGLFRGFVQGGFEASTHRRAHDRARLDMIAATGHDVHARYDYLALRRHGILTVRDGLRWHLIEPAAGRYDWSSLEGQLEAAEATGTEVIWDLLHYGWPDDVDVWTPGFVERFAAFARAAARRIAARAAAPRFYAPINEISFLAWGGGDAAYLNPFACGRGFELKVQLVRAAVAAMEAVRGVDPAARFVHADPVLNVVCDPRRPHEAGAAAGHHQAQFQAWDMIAGRMWPQAGGRPDLLDIIGVNYYNNNQWIHGGPTLDTAHPLHRPFRAILAETHARYGRPIFVAETGMEGEGQAEWFGMICEEVRAAVRLGVPVEGICLYPILRYPGWDDGRECLTGLLGPRTAEGRPTPCAPLAAEIARQLALFRPAPSVAA